jgi:glycosyltransferase involved in cell wall biosynthesis
MSRRVSIIVCTYNAVEDLRECLLSLEQQDYGDKEIVVVNDASTDKTAEYLQSFQRQTQVHTAIITNATNHGVAGSRNVGIRNATGEILAFLDADCIADSRWITELVKIYDQSDVAAVGGKILEGRINNIWSLSNKGHDYIASAEGDVSFVMGCNMSFDADALKSIMFNEEIKYGFEEMLVCDYLRDTGRRIYYAPGALMVHKHRATAKGVMKQKYLRGVSSIWYRKKRGYRICMYKRHLIFLGGLLTLPLYLVSGYFLYAALLCFLVFLLSLLRDELIFAAKSVKELVLTFPFLVMLELVHFAGSCSGVVRFIILSKNRSHMLMRFLSAFCT